MLKDQHICCMPSSYIQTQNVLQVHGAYVPTSVHMHMHYAYILCTYTVCNIACISFALLYRVQSKKQMQCTTNAVQQKKKKVVMHYASA
jgi:hypothetical protein